MNTIVNFPSPMRAKNGGDGQHRPPIIKEVGTTAPQPQSLASSDSLHRATTDVFDLGPILTTYSLSDLLADGRGARLYHGTNSRVLPSILQNGLHPRRQDQAPNHPTMPSQAGYGYLSTVFGPWYAINSSEDEEDLPVVIEIDPTRLDPSNAFPDEDFLNQIVDVTRKVRNARLSGEESRPAEVYEQLPLMDPVAERIQQVGQDMIACQSLCESSIDLLGNMAYSGVIPTSAITRYAVQEHWADALAWRVAFGVEVNITYHVLYAYAMRGLTAHIFDGTSLFPEWDDPAYLDALPRETMMNIRKIKTRMRQEWTKWTKVFAV